MLNLAKTAYKNSVKTGFLRKNFHSSKALQNPDTFMNGTNSIYLEQMYDNWVRDRKSVHPSWDAYFTNVTQGLVGQQAFQMPPEVGVSTQPITRTQPIARTETPSLSDDIQKHITYSFKIYLLVLAYARRGHEIAQLDPLRML
jgi:2-oxoglutarate dehydrogenase complex, dehydrogenase (E1) component, and related enzymes